MNDISGMFKNCKNLTNDDLLNYVTGYRPAWHNYKDTYRVQINFEDSDINERYLMYDVIYIDKKGLRDRTRIILDKDSYKIYSDYRITMSDTKSGYKCHYTSDFYPYNTYVYRQPFTLWQNIVYRFPSLFGMHHAYKKWKNVKKHFDNNEFINFLIEVYEKEIVERDL